MTLPRRERPRRNPWRDAAWLLLLCAVVYTLGLTSHGLTNWQESQRALVAREMYERGEWIVPRVHGRAYIAKPPMIYWIQKVIGHARGVFGATPFDGEIEIRLCVALGGAAGVLGTYFAARSMFRGGRWGAGGAGSVLDHEPLGASDARTGDDAAWLSALGLATGVLYVRSSRIGELDVLIVAWSVAAIALVLAAYRGFLEGRGTRWGLLVLATVAASGAALTKGPPALLVVALGAYGTIVVERVRWGLAEGRAAAGEGAEERAAEGHQDRAWAGVCALVGAIVLPVAALAMDDRVRSIWHALGLVFFAGLGGAAGWAVHRMSKPRAARAWFSALAATHPGLVLGVPVVVVWVWGRMVAARVGGEAVASLASAEVEDNLRLLVLDSPTKNLGFMVYGIAPMSVAALAGLRDAVRTPTTRTAGERAPLVWWGLGFVAFSALGKGVARYLTPLWPAMAMVGGLWLARRERRWPHRRTMLWATMVLVLSGLVQGWWYGVGREGSFGDRSPRSLMRELLPLVRGERLGVWQLADPALDYYARFEVVQWGGKGQRTLAELAATVRSGGGAGKGEGEGEESYVLLASSSAVVSREDRRPLAMALRDEGLMVTPIEVGAKYAWRADRSPVVAWSVEARVE